MKIDESWYIRPPNTPERTAAGGVVVRNENGKLEILLMSSSEGKTWKLPKGGVDGNETEEETAKREVYEEAGAIDLETVAYLDKKEKLTYEKDFWNVVHYFLFTTKSPIGIPTAREKNYISKWFSLDKLPAMYWPEQKELIEENKDKIKELILKIG